MDRQEDTCARRIREGRRLFSVSARAIAVVGAGNFAVTAPVMATLAAYLDAPLRISLFDPHEERLDLAHLFLKLCVNESNSEHAALADNNPAEIIAGADILIWTLDEDAARRLRGTTPHFAEVPEDEPRNVFELVRGDMNRPTPPHQLSQRVCNAIGVPIDQEGSPAEVMTDAVRDLLRFAHPSARHLSLLRNAAWPEGTAFDYLNWPAPIADHLLPAVPHQVLRWARETEPIYDLLRTARQNPLTEWLDGAIRGR
jgi:hypothetical protein